MTTTSTELRKLEGEIAKFDDVGWDLPFTKRLLTIAKELEADRDDLGAKLLEAQRPAAIDRGQIAKLIVNYEEVVTENTRLKQQLDEAMEVLLFYSNEWDAGHDWCDPSNALKNDRGLKARVLLRKLNFKFPSESVPDRETGTPAARAFNDSEGHPDHRD